MARPTSWRWLDAGRLALRFDTGFPQQFGIAAEAVRMQAYQHNIDLWRQSRWTRHLRFSGLPADWRSLRIVEQHYAIFMHTTHVSDVRRTWDAIWYKWLPESSMLAVDAPHFERYDERFDPRTGMGGFEIWLPVKA